jgi:hypothetical protein
VARARRQFTIARLLGAVVAVAIPFALLGSWPTALSLSIGILISIFVTGLTKFEVVVILANAAVISALTIPPVATNCYRSRRAKMRSGWAGGARIADGMRSDRP